ncbi:MAG: hypothetical protein Q9225_006223, partial [Loekoesia sp. 1 TL-2023]
MAAAAHNNDAAIEADPDAELDRLDITHQKFRILLDNKLLLCPVESPERVLDIGTGTGIWAIEYGDDHPDTEIIGTDLSPTQPSWVPPNVKFEVDDCEETWTFPQKFDVVHARYLAAAIVNWPKLMAQAFQFTKPGGYSEFQDYDFVYYSEDGSLTDDLPTSKWITTLLQASRDFGRDPCPGPKLGGYMRDAGFKDVQVSKTSILYVSSFFPHFSKVPVLVPLFIATRTRPLNAAADQEREKQQKTVGSWNLVQIEDGLEAFTLRLFTQTLGWQKEEVQVLLANVRKDMRNPKVHAQFD